MNNVYKLQKCNEISKKISKNDQKKDNYNLEGRKKMYDNILNKLNQPYGT